MADRAEVRRPRKVPMQEHEGVGIRQEDHYPCGCVNLSDCLNACCSLNERCMFR